MITSLQKTARAVASSTPPRVTIKQESKRARVTINIEGDLEFCLYLIQFLEDFRSASPALADPSWAGPPPSESPRVHERSRHDMARRSMFGASPQQFPDLSPRRRGRDAVPEAPTGGPAGEPVAAQAGSEGPEPPGNAPLRVPPFVADLSDSEAPVAAEAGIAGPAGASATPDLSLA
ncbi:MAG: hypothetical protein ACRDZX_10465 [Acidimicrobiales bacterium]